MANEFIARKGLIVLNNGAKVTGSLGVMGDINATGYNITASNLALLGSASIDGDITISGNLTVGNADVDVIKFLAEVSSSITPDINNAFDLGTSNKYWRDLYVSGTAYINDVQATTINLDDITVLDSLTVSGSTFLGDTTADSVNITGSLNISGSQSITGSVNVLGAANFSSGDVSLADDLYVSGGLINVANAATDIEIKDNTTAALTISEAANNYIKIDTNDGSEKITIGNNITSIDNVVEDNTANAFVVKEDTTDYINVNTTNGSEKVTIGNTLVSIDNVVEDNTANAFTIKEGANNYFNVNTTDSAEKVTIGNAITSVEAVVEDNTANAFTVKEGSNTYINIDTTDNAERLVLGNTITSVATVVEDNTSAAYVIAEGSHPYFVVDTTNGSEKFTFQTGSVEIKTVTTISNTTNSTNYANGALIVDGGVGIGKDVYVSGSMTVEGLLTAISMSTQYVTSSQYTIGTSRVVVNDDDLIRFAGLSVIDSGSTYGTGSLLWDSFHNRWIYEADDQAYNSAIIIAGPKNTGSLGDEVGLIVGRIPVATGDDHIDTSPLLTPLRIDDGVFHVEGSQYVTGSVTASAFTGDGSQLTGIVTNLNMSGSEGGNGTVSLKTQALTVSGSNGIAVTVSGQTILVSGSNATTSSIGVASYNGTNFSVAGGQVSSKPINFNGADINLGGTHAFGLQNITPYGASTTDQVSLQGGAIIQGVLFVTASNLDIDSGTEVVATVATGSYDAAFFDYVVKKASNYRVGTVMAVWDGTNNVQFTDTSTNDLGDTADVVFTVDALSGTARLKATVTSNDWIVKTAIRAL